MNVKKIKPMYTKIVTTMDKYVDDTAKTGGLITDVSKLKMGLKEYQKVIAIGTSVRNVKEGDIVCINPDRYAVRKYQESSMKANLMENETVRYNFNVVRLDNVDYLLLDEADVEFVVEEYED